MKDEVPLAVECFNPVYYKLFCINVNNIDKLIKEICNEYLNTSLRNIHLLDFNPQSLLKISTLAKEAKSLFAISYITSLQILFHMNPTDDDKDLAYSNATIDLLQEVLMIASLIIQKLFPTAWANEMLSKLIWIDIKSPNFVISWMGYCIPN